MSQRRFWAFIKSGFGETGGGSPGRQQLVGPSPVASIKPILDGLQHLNSHHRLPPLFLAAMVRMVARQLRAVAYSALPASAGVSAPSCARTHRRHQSRARQPIDNRRDARLSVLRVFTVRERAVLGTGPQLDEVVKAEDAAADRASDAQQPARQRAQVLIRPEAYPVARPPKLGVCVLGRLDWRRQFRVHGVPPQAPHPLATCAHARRAMPPTRLGNLRAACL